MTEQLYRHIIKMVPTLGVGQKELQSYFHTKPIKKEELLLKEGEPCDTIYFVNTGSLYMFYEDAGKQVIHFALENWWITDYKTFPDCKPAVYAIAAMEDSEITYISRADYESLLLQYPLLALYFNQLHERAYGAALLKQKTFATVSKKDFYRNFRRNYPELTGRFPDSIFASYMGISPGALKILHDEYIS